LRVETDAHGYLALAAAQPHKPRKLFFRQARNLIEASLRG
jgi:hypothetical protein